MTRTKDSKELLKYLNTNTKRRRKRTRRKH